MSCSSSELGYVPWTANHFDGICVCDGSIELHDKHVEHTGNTQNIALAQHCAYITVLITQFYINISFYASASMDCYGSFGKKPPTVLKVPLRDYLSSTND